MDACGGEERTFFATPKCFHMIGLFAFTMCFRHRTDKLAIIRPDDLRVTDAVIERPSDQGLRLLVAAELLTGP